MAALVVTAGACLSEAVERAKENGDIEILITDFHLGDGKRGTDVMQSVHGVLGRRINTVLITGDTSSAMREVAHNDFVRLASKPIRAEELLRLLDALTQVA